MHYNYLTYGKGHHIDVQLLKWAKDDKLGPIFTVNVAGVARVMVIADPDWIHHITVTKNFNKSYTYKKMIPMFGPSSILFITNQ